MKIVIRFSIIVAVVVVAAVAGIIPLSAQSFSLSISPATQTITVGETATFNVQITPENGFDATVFLSVQSSLPGVEMKLSGTSINTPYTGVLFTARPASDTDTAVITLTGTNGALKTMTQTTLRVVKNPLWKVVSAKERDYFWGSYLISGKHGSAAGIWYNPFIDRTVVSEYLNGVWIVDSLSWKDFYTPGYYQEYQYDSQRNLWIFTKGKGAFCVKNNFSTQYSTQNSLIIGDSIHDCTFDKEGRAIVLLYRYIDSLNGKGKCQFTLQRFTDNQWIQIYQHELIVNSIQAPPAKNSICSDSSGKIWLAAWEDGLICIDGNNIDTISSESVGISQRSATTVFCDKLGKVWGSFSGQTIVFDTLGWRVSPLILGIIGVDSKNAIWSGVGDRLYQFDGITITEYSSSNSPLPKTATSYGIRSLVIDNNDNIWVGYSPIDQYAPYYSYGYIFNPNGLVGIPIVLSAEEHTPAATALTAFPNPSSAKVTLRGITGNELTITDVLGRNVLTVEIPAGITEQIIETSSLPEGIYLCRAGNASVPIIVRR